LRLLVDRGIDASATIVGDGPRRAHLEGLAGELGLGARVLFTGAVGQHEIPRYYAEADAFCSSSFAEGLPVVLMEAMATSLPVVATRIAGIPELVEDGVNGLLVPPARPDALADALASLAASPARRREMGQNGRDKVVAEFAVDDAAAALRPLFDGARRG
jgi:colanic acid/amylovoran biosynthesis glycosyltransferase